MNPTETIDIVQEYLTGSLTGCPGITDFRMRKAGRDQAYHAFRGHLRLDCVIESTLYREDGHQKTSVIAKIYWREERPNIIEVLTNDQPSRDATIIDLSHPDFTSRLHGAIAVCREEALSKQGSGNKKWHRNRMKWS